MGARRSFAVKEGLHLVHLDAAHSSASKMLARSPAETLSEYISTSVTLKRRTRWTTLSWVYSCSVGAVPEVAEKATAGVPGVLGFHVSTSFVSAAAAAPVVTVFSLAFHQPRNPGTPEGWEVVRLTR